MFNLHEKMRNSSTVSKDATGDDTVKLIVNTINTYAISPFVAKTVEILQRDNPTKLEFLKKLFDVACINVNYLADEPGHEVVYTPQLLMRTGKGDCKKFTVFIASVLKAAGYDGVPKVVKYAPGNDWEHIYVISRDGDNYITLDPVNHKTFNKEVKYSKGRLNFLDGTYSQIMDGNKLSLMGNLGNEESFIQGIGDAADSILGDLDSITGRRSGGGGGGKKAQRQEKRASKKTKVSQETGEPCQCATSQYETEAMEGLREDYINGLEDENISGIGDSVGARKTKEQRKTRRKKIFKFAAKVSMVPTRAAFLGLIALGRALEHTKLKMNLAAKLAKSWQSDNGAKIMKIWETFGGDRKTIANAISKAAHVKVSGIGANGDVQVEGLEGIGVYTAAAAAAAITAATPIVLGVMKMLKKDKVVSPEESQRAAAVTETLESAANVVDGGLKPEALKELAESTIVKYGAQMDKGGNQEAAAEIKKDNETDFKTSSTSQQNATPTQQSTPQAEQTQDTQGADVPPRTINPQYLPTVQSASKSMFGSIKLPTVWIRICILIMLLSNYVTIPKNFIHAMGYLAISGLIVTSIYLFTNNPTKWQRRKRKSVA